MPMVRAYVMPRFAVGKTGLPHTTYLHLLQYACEEIVPAGLNSKQGPLTPGSIEFIPTVVESGLNIGVVIDIEAYFYEDRLADLSERYATIEERAEAMKNAFNEIFTDTTFAVFPKLVTAGWSSDTPDADFDGDMSMGAAVKRYNTRVTNLVLDQG